MADPERGSRDYIYYIQFSSETFADKGIKIMHFEPPPLFFLKIKINGRNSPSCSKIPGSSPVNPCMYITAYQFMLTLCFSFLSLCMQYLPVWAPN